MTKQRRRRGSWATSRRWTAAIAREALDELERSGESVAAFASREGISDKRLYHWRSLLKDHDRPLFIEVEPRAVGRPEDHGSGGLLEVVVRSGRLVRVPPDFDATALRRLVAALEDEPC